MLKRILGILPLLIIVLATVLVAKSAFAETGGGAGVTGVTQHNSGNETYEGRTTTQVQAQTLYATIRMWGYDEFNNPDLKDSMLKQCGWCTNTGWGWVSDIYQGGKAVTKHQYQFSDWGTPFYTSEPNGCYSNSSWWTSGSGSYTC